MRTHPNRETIAVDALLVRAYREKRVDRIPLDPGRLLGARGPSSIGSNVLSRGERVDTSSFGATAVARSRETFTRINAAGEALVIAHDLVLSLDNYYAEDAAEDALGFTLWTKAGALETGRVITDKGGDRAYIQAAEVREEGGVFHAAPLAGTRVRPVRRIVVAPLIVLAGRAGEPPYVSPVEVERERPVMCPRGKRRIGTRSEYVTPLALVRRERSDYAAWHHAITAVADQLAGVASLVVTLPAAAARPWEAEAIAA